MKHRSIDKIGVILKRIKEKSENKKTKSKLQKLIQKQIELLKKQKEDQDKEQEPKVRNFYRNSFHIEEWPYPFRSGLFYDPIENTPDYQNAMQSIEPRLPVHQKMGDCYYIWNLKQKLLKKEYNIDWKTPEELNPHILFD